MLCLEAHGKEESSKETLDTAAQSFYDKFSPFQSLAYWFASSILKILKHIQFLLYLFIYASSYTIYRFDLIQNYETTLGKLSELSPLDYKSVSGSSHMKRLKAD